MAFPLLQASSKTWSKAEEAKLKQLVRHNTLPVVCLVLGRPESAVVSKAKELGIRLKK